jgi:phage terminase large subunit
MIQQVNSVYKPLFTHHPRYFILMGGRGAGRSTVASQFANSKLIAPEYFRCAIMRYILGDIRNSIYREITDRAEENGIEESLKINESTMSIEYGQNSINAAGFKKSSGDQKSKMKSLANFNCVIIEEADEIPEEDFMQLDDSLRTVKGGITVILLLNPPAKTHWIIRRWFDLLPSGVKDFYIAQLKPERTDAVHIFTTYLDNIKNIDPASAANFENYKLTNPKHYYNIVKGLVPEVVRGKIYSGWVQIDELPHEARLERYGLDFGFSNDPTTFIAVYRYNGGLIFDEVLYRKGMLNKPLADILLNQPQSLIVADSEDPKSITELNTYGLSVIGARKGADSVRFGISTVQQQRCSVTKRSTHLWEEYMNYSWFEDKDGKTLNTPKPGYDHCMDALRYAVKNLIPEDKVPVAQFSGQEILNELLGGQ